MKYVVYAALHDESNAGWVWLSRPQLGSRSLVHVRNLKNGRTVYCQLREIDDNFVALYDDCSRTINLAGPDRERAAVIGDWYRRALGIPSTQSSEDLDVTRARIPGWHAIRACCQHPEPVVRLAARLGVWSVWLGLLGLAFSMYSNIPWRHAGTFSAGVLVIIAVIALYATRGIGR
jgi:hypothetical protein